MLNETLRAREIANHSDRFVRANSRGSDLKIEIKKEVARVSECDSRAQYRSGGRDRSYDSAGRSSPRGSPRSSGRYYGSEERDTSRYGTQGQQCNKDSGSRKYRDNSRERYVSRHGENSRESRDRVCYNCKGSGYEMQSCPNIKCFSCGRRGHVSRYCRDKGGDVGYDRRGSGRRSGGSRDNSYERYGSRDSSRERYRGRESPRETRDKLSRYRDNSMDKLEGERYKESARRVGMKKGTRIIVRAEALDSLVLGINMMMTVD
ncbi:serine/threonine-protein kinase fray2-like [Watersipora subatra]|uniref:serine/threonine-protein kinase fray2-like n=1 Tax=Watersipora subatra TaxID=2589382 RepID=UPI00355B5710